MKKAALLCCLCLSLSSVSFAAWEERELIPADYEKIRYSSDRKLFWLYSADEKMPRQYHQLGDQTRSIPVGRELASLYLMPYEENNQSKALLRVYPTGDKEKVGLVDFDGNEVLAPIVTKDIYGYKNGVLDTKEGFLVNGELTHAAKKDEYFYRVSRFEDGWRSNKNNKNSIINPKGEVLFELSYIDEFRNIHEDFIVGKSNGQDGKEKAYRLWNWDKEEITPIESGFQSLVLMYGKKSDGTNELVGLLGKTKSALAFYSYKGEGNFTEPEVMDLKIRELSGSAYEVSPGFYRLSGKEDAILDLKNKKLYPEKDDLIYNGTRLVQSKVVAKSTFIPIIVPVSGGSGFFAMGDTIRGNERMRYRFYDLEGKTLFDLWESVEYGEEVIINRKKGETQIVDYDGKLIRGFKSTKEGYIPLVGKYKKSGEADEPIVGSMWPGKGKYQPYYNGVGWGILDKDTGKDILMPDAKYGYIITVDAEGKRFWSLFGSGEGKGRRYGVKQFDWAP